MNALSSAKDPRSSVQHSGRRRSFKIFDTFASGLLDAKSEGDDGFEGVEGRVAVVLLLRFREGGVGDEAGMVFLRVVALGPVDPSFGKPLPRPDVVGVLRQPLPQL